jgi:two-component system, NtrC family, response regulator AtoC
MPVSGHSIFIVEDDPFYGQLLQYHLGLNPDHVVRLFTDGKSLLKALHERPAVITLDLSLPDMSGEDLFKRIKDADASAAVIVVSGQEDVARAVALLKLGVRDYIVKDDNAKDLLWSAIQRVRETQALVKEVEELRTELGRKYDFNSLIKGNSPSLQKVFQVMEKATRTSINVSITGETGTGKELVAKAIHFNSERKKAPFVAVNMAAIPSELVESELFGHEKGAFTGAVARKLGKFEEAQKGTLFLDEVAEMDAALQSKLLRVLQERELTRVGGEQLVKLDVRLVVATHKDLAKEVQEGRFREDLYYRIMGIPIELPPLRDRGNDILLLAQAFLDGICKQEKMPAKKLTPKAKERLLSYPFPGNVRELRSAIELAAVMSEGPVVDADDITFRDLRGGAGNFLMEEKSLRGYTVDIIKHFLKKYDNNVVRTAEKLDVGKSTIYTMIKNGEITL